MYYITHERGNLRGDVGGILRTGGEVDYQEVVEPRGTNDRLWMGPTGVENHRECVVSQQF